MDKEVILRKTAEHVRKTLQGDGSAHDWWHISRVWRIAVQIGSAENADLFVVQLAALLHDIGDWKFHDGDDSVGPRIAREWLASLSVDEKIISHVCEIIAGLSFKGAGHPTRMTTTEGMVVQDADRLDALGAIGVARAFAYGGFSEREIYNPDVAPEHHTSVEHYRKSAGPTINHFYEKLLLLKDLMNTPSGRTLAAGRHAFMEQYLKRFYEEWNGKA